MKLMKFRNPYKTILKAAKELFGNLDCVIFFDDTIGKHKPPYGYVEECKDLGIVQIGISPYITIVEAAHVLIHEICHVAVGLDNNHNKKWKKAVKSLSEKCYK